MGIRSKITYSPGVLPTPRLLGRPTRFIRHNRWDPRRAAASGEPLPVFHASEESPDEFLKAPAIHVGSHGVANFVDKFNVHQFQLSPHASVHPHVFTDNEADEAAALMYKENGADYEYAGAGQHDSPAYQALKENKVIMYRNSGESDVHVDMTGNKRGKFDHDYPTTQISMIVPNPWMNLHKKGEAPPTSQPVLPMDYSPAFPSEKTKRERRR